MTDGQATETAAPADDAPVRIGPYRILRLLGEGGMGVVYLADQEKPLRRRVALKVIKIGMDTRDVVARFESERQALALMDHPNIAQVFDAGSSETGRPYFAMEYVPGARITDYCDQHRLSTRARLELFIKVCRAIQHAHQKGIIHRDIKPSNVLVMQQDGRPEPKVIDFGVARATHHRLTAETVFTQQGRLIGTLEYMSPEQAGSDGLDVDTVTDVYSLGVLLYELLVGVLPFDSTRLRRAGYAEIQRIIRDDEPARPSARLRDPESGGEVAQRRESDVHSLERELRGDLDSITLKAMAKDRALRYPAASELAADIQRYLANDPVLARPTSLGYRLKKFAQKHKAMVAAGALAVSGLAAGLAVSLIMYSRSERARQEAEWQSYVAAISAAAAQIAGSGITTGNRLAPALEAERRLLAAPANHRNWEWNYLAHQLDPSVATLWGTTDPINVFAKRGNPNDTSSGRIYGGDLAISPDQRELLWTAQEGVHAWDLSTSRLVAAWPAYGVVSAMSRDGSRVLSANWQRTDPWRIVATRTGAIVSILSTKVAGLQMAAFSTDGQRLAAVGSDGSLHLWSTDTGQEIATGMVPAPAAFVRFAAGNEQVIVGAGANLFVWSTRGPGNLRRLASDSVSQLAVGDIMPSGEVVVGDTSGTVSLWALDSGKVSALGNHRGLKAIAVSQTGQLVATSGTDRLVRVWTRGKTTWSSTVLDAHGDLPIDAVLFTPDNTRVVAASARGVLRVWELKAICLAFGTCDFPPGFGGGFAVSPNGRFVLHLGRLDDLETGQSVEVLQPSTVDRMLSSLSGSAISNDGNVAVFPEGDTVWIWRRGRTESPIQLAKLPGGVSFLAADAEGTRIAIAWMQRPLGSLPPTERLSAQLRVVDSSSGQVIFSAEDAQVSGLRFDLAGRLLTTSGGTRIGVPAPNCKEGDLKLWDVTRGRAVLTLPGCLTGRIAGGGSRILTYSEADSRFRVWNAQTGSLVSESDALSNAWEFALSDDGSRVAVAMSNQVGIFDALTATLLLTIDSTRQLGQPYLTRFFGFSPSGSLLIVSFSDTLVIGATPHYSLAARRLARELLGFGDLRPATQAGEVALSDEVIRRLKGNTNLDPDLRRSTIDEIQRIGDWDVTALCRAGRDLAIQPGRSETEYRRAINMTAAAARFAPWSAFCVSAFGMARYRTGDYPGVLQSLTAAESLGQPLSGAELAFKAMTLYRLGRKTEAAVVAELLRTPSKNIDQSAPELLPLLRELDLLATGQLKGQ